MVIATPVHPEGPRYAAPIAYFSGVWMGSHVWRQAASYLAHRGWAGTLLDTRAVKGGIAARAAAAAEHLRALPAAPVLVGHDAGALVALATATRIDVPALVLVSPLSPGAPGTHAVAWSPGLVWSLLRRRPVPAPVGSHGDAFFAGLSPDVRRTVGSEDPRLLAELARRSRIGRPTPMPPTLVLRGGADPVLSRDDAGRVASDLGAQLDEIADQGHWPLASIAWQECVHRMHRWLVQRLGAPNLELYAEAMAERGEDPDEP
jgi:pimeloyl-ACP methyl ester carboxylesterase